MEILLRAQQAPSRDLEPPKLPAELIGRIFSSDKGLAHRMAHSTLQNYLGTEGVMIRGTSSERGFRELLAAVPHQNDPFYRQAVSHAREVFSDTGGVLDPIHLHGMRRALLETNRKLPEKRRVDLTDVENGAVFGTFERALRAGVPHEVVYRTFPGALGKEGTPTLMQYYAVVEMMKDRLLAFHGMTAEEIAQDCGVDIDLPHMRDTVERLMWSTVFVDFLSSSDWERDQKARPGPPTLLETHASELCKPILNSPRFVLFKENPHRSVQEIELQARERSEHYAGQANPQLDETNDMLMLRTAMVSGPFKEAMLAKKPFVESAIKYGLDKDDHFLPMMQKVAADAGVEDTEPTWALRYTTGGEGRLTRDPHEAPMVLTASQRTRLENALKEGEAVPRWAKSRDEPLEAAPPLRGSVQSFDVSSGMASCMDMLRMFKDQALGECAGPGSDFPKSLQALPLGQAVVEKLAMGLDGVPIGAIDPAFVAEVRRWDDGMKDVGTLLSDPQLKAALGPQIEHLMQVSNQALRKCELIATSRNKTEEAFIKDLAAIPGAGPHLLSMVDDLAQEPWR